MSCNYCEKYNGLNNFCLEDEFIETGLELINCDEYHYNGKLRYYNWASGEKEVKQIIINVFRHFLEMALNGISLGFKNSNDSILDNELYLKLNNILADY